MYPTHIKKELDKFSFLCNESAVPLDMERYEVKSTWYHAMLTFAKTMKNT
jgi:hypothetical protein